MKHYLNFVAGKWLGNDELTPLAVNNPATSQVAASVTRASKSQVLAAVEAAAKAQAIWKRLPAIQRAEALRRLADELVARKNAIGQALVAESGKSLEDAENEAVYAADITRFHAEWARRIEGEVIPSDAPNENLVLHREPMGVVACFIPFNYPVYTLLRKIAPALIVGNAVLVRPSNHTPTSAFEIAKAVEAAGLPHGLISIMTMDHEQAAHMCTHPKVTMMTLTGGLNAGRTMLEYAKVNIAKTSLELGGKTPAIITAGADLAKAAADIVRSRTTHCGQLCTAVERVYAHESVHDELVTLLTQHIKARTIGNRSEDASRMGPLVSPEARAHIHGMVQKAVEQGATLVCGGELPAGPGNFYPATLLTGVPQKMDIVREEIFGPVLPVLKFSDIDQALELANDHQFGLASVLYSEDYRCVQRFANEIEAGELYVNRTPADPYQGYHAGWKRSGLGGDDGKHGMLEFTQTRLVILPY
jgi:lactaldehyde dehydrogenase / glycolaldehyde dehydrogenase